MTNRKEPISQTANSIGRRSREMSMVMSPGNVGEALEMLQSSTGRPADEPVMGAAVN